MVCGFHVTILLEEGEACFGDEDRRVEVIIKMSENAEFEWTTGYLLDDYSIQDSICHLLLAGQASTSYPTVTMPLQRKAPGRPHASSYSLSDEDFDNPGAINLLSLRILQGKLEQAGATRSVSAWLKTYVQTIIISTSLSAIRSTFNRNKTRNQRFVLSQRLEVAAILLDPGLIEKDDMRKLLNDVRYGPEPLPVATTPDPMNEDSLLHLCDCSSKVSYVQHAADCFPNQVLPMLKEFAWKLWVFAHMEYEAQNLLRDIGPMDDWKVLWEDALKSVSSEDDTIPHCITTTDFLKWIARRLAGRDIYIENDNCLGIVAGGAVVGLKGNEAIPILEDPGHCVFIYPGSMETPERRIRGNISAYTFP